MKSQRCSSAGVPPLGSPRAGNVEQHEQHEQHENADTAPRSTGENAESSATDLAGALPGLVRLVCRQAVFVPAAASTCVGTNVCLILSNFIHH